MKYANSPPPTNSSAEEMMNGAAQRRSFLYRPGEMNAQNWYSTHGAARNSDTTSGSLNQMMEIPSVGSMAIRLGCNPSDVSAAAAGWRMMSHNCLLKEIATMNAAPSPHRQRISRARSSSKCSMKDMRSMPSSSSSSAGGGAVGGGVRVLPPADASGLSTGGITSCSTIFGSAAAGGSLAECESPCPP